MASSLANYFEDFVFGLLLGSSRQINVTRVRVRGTTWGWTFRLHKVVRLCVPDSMSRYNIVHISKQAFSTRSRHSTTIIRHPRSFVLIPRSPRSPNRFHHTIALHAPIMPPPLSSYLSESPLPPLPPALLPILDELVKGELLDQACNNERGRLEVQDVKCASVREGAKSYLCCACATSRLCLQVENMRANVLISGVFR